MKRLRWLIILADRKPLLFSVALLLIAVMILASVIINRQKEIDRCTLEKAKLREDYDKRLVEIQTKYSEDVEKLNLEVKKTLTVMLDDYKAQLEEQKNLNKAISNTIMKNQRLIKSANTQIKKLR